MSSPDRIPHKADKHHTTEHQARPIHRARRHRKSRREEAENDGDCQEADGVDVDDQSQSRSHVERTHAYFFVFHTLDDHEDDRDGVGGEKTGNSDGDDGVEGDGAADVDEADECGDGGAEDDAAEREGGLANVRQEAGEWKTAISGESPGLAGSGREEAETGTGDKCNEDCGHDGGTSVGVGCGEK